MLGAPLDGSVLLLGDNKSVVFKLNTTIPSSVAIAAHIVCCCHVDTQVNLADVLNKHLSNDHRWFCWCLLFLLLLLVLASVWYDSIHIE